MRKETRFAPLAVALALGALGCRTEEPGVEALGAERGACEALSCAEPSAESSAESSAEPSAPESGKSGPAGSAGATVARPPGTALQPTMSPDHWGATRETPRPSPTEVEIGPPEAPGAGGQDAREPGPDRGARGAPPAHPGWQAPPR